jgi:hypothetical protein
MLASSNKQEQLITGMDAMIVYTAEEIPPGGSTAQCKLLFYHV